MKEGTEPVVVEGSGGGGGNRVKIHPSSRQASRRPSTQPRRPSHHSVRRLSVQPPKEEKRWWQISKDARNGLAITVLWTLYVLAGSCAFIYLERLPQETQVATQHSHWTRFKALAGENTAMQELLSLRYHLLEMCAHPVLNSTFGLLEGAGNVGLHHEDPPSHQARVGLPDDWAEAVEEECGEALEVLERVTRPGKHWSMVDAIYYTMTAVTTIGYGHIYPTNPKGRLFCVLYCLVGVPLTCILLAYSTEMLSDKMVLLYSTARKRFQRHRKLLLYGITWIYLSVGFIVLMFLPSLALSRIEGWTYEEALYYTFITLTTIGFGDYYAGYQEGQAYSELYKMVLVVWIMLALGYWFLLLNFLQKALKSHVPRKIKKTLRSKRMTKQAEFFRQLVGKVLLGPVPLDPSLPADQVRLGQRKASIVDDDRGVVALMVEVADALTAEPGRTSRKPSLVPRVSLCTHGTLDTDDSEESDDPLTLSDLLDVNVVLRSATMPAIRSLVRSNSFVNTDSSSSENATQALHGLLSKVEEAEEEEEAKGEGGEVTLPLREVLHLVSIVASVEEQVNKEEEEDKDDTKDSLTPSLPSSNSFDHRESVPLLKDLFCLGHPAAHARHIAKAKAKLSQQDEDEIDEALNELHGSEYDEEEDDEEEEEEEVSQEEGEEDEDEEDEEEEGGGENVALRDVEAGNLCTRGKIGCVHKR